MGMQSPGALAGALLAALPSAAPVAAQQLGVSEIGRADLVAERSTRLPPQASAALNEAGELYAAGDSEGALPILEDVIAALEELALDAGNDRELAGADPRLFETIRTAHLFLAAAHWTLEDPEATDLALDRIIRLDPSFELDEATAGAQLTGRLAARREQLVGRISFVVLPLDANIVVDGRRFLNGAQPVQEQIYVRTADEAAANDRQTRVNGEVERTDDEAGDNAEAQVEPFLPPEPTPLLAGDYFAEVSRPGYLATTAVFEIVGGEDLELRLELERDSAVLRLRTAPTGATVLVNGIERGLTSGQAEPWFEPEGPGAGHPPEDFSNELWIDDLPPGRYRIDVEKDGFRSYRTSVQLADLRDVDLPPIVLEREEAVIGLAGLAEGATVTANGRVLRPDWSRTPPRIRLPPGAYDISVTQGSLGYFETSVVAEDGRRLDIDVTLRPALVHLGLLGDDPAGARAFAPALETFQNAGIYSVLDRAAEGGALLADLGLNAETLRQRAADGAASDWADVREQIENRFPAALYLVAVLNDDLVADAVDLWWLAASPAPARADIRTLRIEDGRLDAEALARLAGALDPPLNSQRPHFGAVLIDSPAGNPPVVAGVEPGSPAADAGLRPGMELIALGEAALTSSLEVTLAIEALEPGDTLEVTTLDGEGTAVRVVEPAWGRAQLDVLDTNLLPSATIARLLQELERVGDLPRWLLELELARLLLAGGDPEAAIRRLRAIDAPGRNGLGRDTVEYTLGLALVTLAEDGREGYRRRARAIFESLTDSERGRLDADGGPLIAHRARLQVEALADN